MQRQTKGLSGAAPAWAYSTLLKVMIQQTKIVIFIFVPLKCNVAMFTYDTYMM